MLREAGSADFHRVMALYAQLHPAEKSAYVTPAWARRSSGMRCNLLGTLVATK